MRFSAQPGETNPDINVVGSGQDLKSDIWILSNKSQGQKMQGDGGFALQ